MKVLWPHEDEDTSKWKLLYQDSIVIIYEKGQRLLPGGVIRKYFSIQFKNPVSLCDAQYVLQNIRVKGYEQINWADMWMKMME
jgi:hypothetical protein